MSLFSQFHQYLDLTCSPESCQCGIRSYSQSSIVPSRLPSTIISSTAGTYPLNLKVVLETVHGHRTIHSTSRTNGKRKKRVKWSGKKEKEKQKLRTLVLHIYCNWHHFWMQDKGQNLLLQKRWWHQTHNGPISTNQTCCCLVHIPHQKRKSIWGRFTVQPFSSNSPS